MNLTELELYIVSNQDLIQNKHTDQPWTVVLKIQFNAIKKSPWHDVYSSNHIKFLQNIICDFFCKMKQSRFNGQWSPARVVNLSEYRAILVQFRQIFMKHRHQSHNCLWQSDYNLRIFNYFLAICIQQWKEKLSFSCTKFYCDKGRR